MRAPANEINAFEILKTVMRPHMQHLAKVVGQVEGRSGINIEILLPIRGRQKLFKPDTLFNIPDADALQTFESQRAESLPIGSPIDTGTNPPADRHEDIEGRVARRGQTGIGHTCILHVKRWICRRRATLLNLS